MSSTKPYVYQGLPGFDIDPVTGRYFPVPVDFRAVFGSGGTKGSSKRSKLTETSAKKYKDVQSIQSIEYRKSEAGVRKGLFNVASYREQLPKSFKGTKTRIPSLRAKQNVTCGSNEEPKAPDVETSHSMSATKRYVYQGLPGFDIDPVTGIYFPVPVDFKAVFGSGGTGGGSKRPKLSETHAKKFKAVFSSSGGGTKRPTFGETSGNKFKGIDVQSTQPVKYRKGEAGVRKELFKVRSDYQQPPTEPLKSTNTRISSVRTRQNLTKLLHPGSNESVKKYAATKKLSPMNTICEDSETRLSSFGSEGYPFKYPVSPILKFTTKEEKDNNCDKTPNSLDSNIDEFLKLEQLYKTPKIKKESPMTTVCNLFESKMLLDKEKEQIAETASKRMTQREIIREIKRIATLDQALYEDMSRKIKEVIEQQARHKDNLMIITSLVNKLDDGTETNLDHKSDDKENSSVRRSLRLQNKSPDKGLDRTSRSVAGSPVILKPDDLRKSALTKNMVDRCQKYKIESPRLQKALDMYNSTKNSCSALLTPKLSRGQLVEPSAGSVLRNNLSRKVQQQCLMLQDTPVHK